MLYLSLLTSLGVLGLFPCAWKLLFCKKFRPLQQYNYRTTQGDSVLPGRGDFLRFHTLSTISYW